MDKRIEIIRKTRSYLLDNLKDLSTEQLNHIPEGFSNNIIWNLSHMVAVQQGICYVKAGLTPPAGDDFFSTYKPTSIPEKFVNATKIENIKTLMFTMLDQFEIDYENHLFNNYVPWTTRYGFELANIDDGINFLTFHDGMHSGYCNLLKKMVSKVAV